MSFQPNYKNKSQPQYPSDEKGAYYKSSDQSSDHPLSRINYCIDFIEKTCPKGDACKKRHIYYAQLRKELKNIQAPYKKHLCQTYESTKKCPKSKYLCLFAHGESDIWNSKYQEKKAQQINLLEVDERKKHLQKQKPQGERVERGQAQNQQIQQMTHKKDDIIQQIIQMKKQELLPQGAKPKKEEKKFKKEKQEFKNVQQQQHVPQQSSRNNQREKSNQQSQQQQFRVQNNQRNQDVCQKALQKRNDFRTNNKAQQPNPDAMTDEEFEKYLLSLKEEQLMNEQGDEQDIDYLDDEEDDQQNDGSDDIDNNEDDDDDEDEGEQKDFDSSSSSDNKDNDLFINEKNKKQGNKSQSGPRQQEKINGKKNKQTEEESWESEDEDDDEDIKEKKDSQKQQQQNKKIKDNQQTTQYFQDFKNIDWEKVDPNKMTNQQLMSLHAAILHNDVDSQDEEESDENNTSKEYNQLDEQKLEEERQKRKQERAEQRKRKKEEKKQQKQQEKDKKSAYIQKQVQYQKNNAQSTQLNQNNNSSAPASSQNKDSLFQFDQLEIFCFCYFNTEADLKNWKESLLEIFFELQIPRNALIITEEDRCEGEFGILIKLKSLRVVCLQLLRINLYKTSKLKILFKVIANPDSQILFSKQVMATKKLNDYSFQGQDGQTYILFNSTIDHSESENLEFKNYDFRNYNENTRKLEEVITGMLNREEFENEQFYNKEEISGKIYLGVKDSTRQFVGSCTTNNHHESFFTFLAKRLRDCQPAIKANLYQREECRLVIPGETENEFYPILDMKIFIITVSKPEKNNIYATSSGLYFQKIEEGNWPMSACALYEKKQKNYISEEKFKLALKQLDRRYFYVMAKMANQNALIQSDYNNIEQSQF